MMLALLLLAQDLPPELKRDPSSGYDPALPGIVRPVIEKAVEAELDKTRGPGNAVEILRTERGRHQNQQEQLAIDLRLAAIVLRQKFLLEPKLPEPVRYAEALSTYSRLDLSDPGLKAWLDRAIQHGSPEAKAALLDPKKRAFPIAFEGRGGLDTKDLTARYTALLKGAGLSVATPTEKNPGYLARLAALEVRDEAGTATVRVTMEITQPKGTYRKTVYRATSAPSAKAALDAASEWLLRIGGRDVLFHWFEEQGLKGAVLTGPESAHAHEDGPGGGHGH
ncbi:MAG: hypothetical protein U1E65_23885 [Myxococcota bacterium]